MPDRYHIHTVPTPGKFRRVGKYGSIDWREDCSRCTNCVKLRCLYDVYRKEAAYNRDPQTALQPHYECKACLSCVQGCTKGLLGIALSPEFLALGDAYWRPDILATTWNQADTGRIPVSGAGYRGRFSGPGFDSIWTDMSEIVRPTRDGIHGREYISTMVEVGTRAMRLNFAPDGSLETAEAEVIELQLPAILDLAPCHVETSALAAARAAAALELKTLCVARAADLADVPADQLAWVAPLISRQDLPARADLLRQVRLVEIADGPDLLALAAEARAIRPGLLVAARLDLLAGTADRVVELARSGIKVLHLCADLHGRQRGVERPLHIKDALRAIHGRLVAEGVRDEVTLIIGGGIALAEHMAKAVICGGDLVAVSTALLVALGCNVCPAAGNGSCQVEPHCPVELHEAERSYTAQRMINLMGAWHSQLIEVLGAMGIREVRRLRGEVGRAIFQEDIEKEAFGDLIRK